MLAAVTPRDGRAARAAPRRDRARRRTRSCAELGDAPGRRATSCRARARGPADPRAAEEFYAAHVGRAGARRERDRRAARPHLQKTVLPVRGGGERLDPARAGAGPAGDREPRSSGSLREATPEGAEVEVELWSWSEPGLVPPDAPAIQLALDAFERALGVRPLLIRSGGTLPIVPALAKRGHPGRSSPAFALPDSNIHSPNERLLVEYVPLGIAAARELFVVAGPRCAELRVRPTRAGSRASHSCPKRRISAMIGRSASPLPSARTRRAAATRRSSAARRGPRARASGGARTACAG